MITKVYRLAAPDREDRREMLLQEPLERRSSFISFQSFMAKILGLLCVEE